MLHGRGLNYARRCCLCPKIAPIVIIWCLATKSKHLIIGLLMNGNINAPVDCGRVSLILASKVSFRAEAR